MADKPNVVSFHFGAPSSGRVQALRNAGIVLLGSATSVDEARILVAAGIHAVVAQGYEAGGHRGIFDPDADDDRLGTMALTRLLVRELDVPVIAAGGIMDGALAYQPRCASERASDSLARPLLRARSRKPMPATERP